MDTVSLPQNRNVNKSLCNEIQTLSMQPLGHCSWGILPSCPPQILELVIIPARSPAKIIKIVFTSSWKLALTQFPIMDFLKRQWYWPALLLHVLPPLQQVLTARQRRRGRTWADGGLGTPGTSVQRSDAKNYTEPSAEPRHWAAAPGWNLTNQRQKWADEHEEVQSKGACVCVTWLGLFKNRHDVSQKICQLPSALWGLVLWWNVFMAPQWSVRSTKKCISLTLRLDIKKFMFQTFQQNEIGWHGWHLFIQIFSLILRFCFSHCTLWLKIQWACSSFHQSYWG